MVATETNCIFHKLLNSALHSRSVCLNPFLQGWVDAIPFEQHDLGLTLFVGIGVILRISVLAWHTPGGP